jgi:ADP-ribosylglycohydrolase
MNEHDETLRGSLVGFLVGDALSFPYATSPIVGSIEMIEGPDGQVGNYTAASSTILCTIASINECHKIDYDDLMEKFYDLYVNSYLVLGEDYVNVGPLVAQALENYSNSLPPDKCGPHDVERIDGECLFRVLPAALYCTHQDIDDVIPMIHQLCQLTHPQIISQIYCVLYYLIIKNIFLQKAEQVFDCLREYYIRNKMEEYKTKLDDIQNWRKEHTCQGTNEINDCFWTTWNIYTEYPDFQARVGRSIRASENVNIIAPLVGSLSSLTDGLDDIPFKWLNKLRLNSEAIDIMTQFLNSILSK